MIASTKTDKEKLILPPEPPPSSSSLSKKKYTSSSSSSSSSSTTTRSQYCFKSIETLPGFNDEAKARQVDPNPYSLLTLTLTLYS